MEGPLAILFLGAFFVGDIKRIGRSVDFNANLPTPRACAEKWSEKVPYVHNRFSLDELTTFCKRSQHWLKEARKASPSLDEQISRGQIEFLTKMRTCKGLDCFEYQERICKGPCDSIAFYEPKSGISKRSVNDYIEPTKRDVAIDVSSLPLVSLTELEEVENQNLLDDTVMEKLVKKISGIFAKGQHPQKSNATAAAQRQQVGKICLKVLNATTVDEAVVYVPKQSLILRAKRKLKFKLWSRKCKQLKKKLEEVGKGLPNLLVSEEEPQNDEGEISRSKPLTANELKQQRTEIASICHSVANATKPKDAFPHFTAKGTGAQKRLEETFVDWKRACTDINDRLQYSQGKTIDDWMPGRKLKKQQKKNQKLGESKKQKKHKQKQTKKTKTMKHKLLQNENNSIIPLRFKRAFMPNWKGASLRLRRQTTNSTLPQPSDFQIDAVLANNGTLSPRTGVDVRARRKEYRMLSWSERQRFHAAVNQLKSEQIDGLSRYDLFVLYHYPTQSPGAHSGPAFLPFHRELLKQVEVALRNIDPDVALPYWDSNLDDGLPVATDSLLWTEDFLGNGDGFVRTGPFVNWVAAAAFMPNNKSLFRDIGASPFGGMFRDSDVAYANTKQAYEELTLCVDPTFELVHGLPHMFIGGQMADIGVSPNDPAFFLHHCFIDYLWEDFRLTKQTRKQRESDYPTDERSCNSYHFGETVMKPFQVKNIDGLSNNYTDQYFVYEPPPTCNDQNPSCGSPYLFCNTKRYHCVAKIKLYGNCRGFDGMDACYNGTCFNRTCVPTDSVPADFSTQKPATRRTTTSTSTTSTSLQTTTVQPTVAITEPSTIRIVPETTRTTEPTTTLSTTSTSTTTTTTPTTTTTTTTTPTTTATTTTATTTTTTSTTTHTSTTTPQPTTSTTIKTTPPITTKTTIKPTAAATRSTPKSTTEATTTIEATDATTLPETTEPKTTTQASTVAKTTVKPTYVTTHFVTSDTLIDEEVTTETAKPYCEGTACVRTTKSTTTATPTTTKPAATYVWFSITIIRGAGYYRGAVPNATVETISADYGRKLSGTVSQSHAFPAYLGAAVAKIRNPAKTAGGVVQGVVRVTDENGAACKARCLGETRKYADCDGAIRISTDSTNSDPVHYADSETGALENAWTVTSTHRQHRLDYLMFQCPSPV